MGYMKKILGWLPRKYLLLIAIGMSLTALDGIIIPSFISGLIDVSATQKVEDLIKISMIGIISFSLIRFGLFIWEDSQQKMIKQVTLSLKEKVITAFFYGKFNQQEVESIVLSELKLLEEQGIKSIMGFFLLSCICVGYFVICVRNRFKTSGSLYYVIILTNISTKTICEIYSKAFNGMG